MPVLPDIQSDLFVEETRFRAGLSEALFMKMGSAVNFINHKYLLQKQFFLNGPNAHAGGALPFDGVDGSDGYPFNISVVDFLWFSNVKPTSGTVEVDCSFTTSSGGAFTSFFTTTPKAISTSSNFAYSYATGGAAPTGITKPVMTAPSIFVPAYSLFRASLVQKAPGSAQVGLIMFFKVTN